ncbi:MAG: cell division protein ZapB [Deltaproteobacteria bacterium]|nr:cell division protein ZapB [Deltaproteobacteria bacterium]MBW2071726.1 cell division protein ZapB [Deltaproteobacteria bacterium]
MGEERFGVYSETVTDEGVQEESPFDRLEKRIDVLIERYEQLREENSACKVQLAEKEDLIQKLEGQMRDLEQQKSEVRSRLDSLIDKLNRFS